ncbi:hypothetical protein HETIRDRAFT_17013, partial [Heterobasidion irregulare TC 32-1]
LDPICKPCLSGKMHAHLFSFTDFVTLKPLELIHFDLYSPLPVITYFRMHYWIIFIDEFTNL